MNKTITLSPYRGFTKTLLVLAILFQLMAAGQSFSQVMPVQKLEKMPPDLERDFALSALPPHLRSGAAIYLLDPVKGYYLFRKGTNSFVCFIARTEWEWANFRADYAMPMSYDSAGDKAIFTVYKDVAAMRASGKYTPEQVKAIVIDRIRKGVYKAPSRPGISYMLSPVMRGYMGDPGDNHVMTMNGPHYMFYAPYMNDSDIGGSIGKGPFVGDPADKVLGNKRGPHGYIIVPMGKKEKADIMKNNAELIRRLEAYKRYFRTTTSM